ncbi:MAG: ftsH-2 [Deltaproteobacteria bacterium]|nr:ftsH-2 [Deltaproteobacteria bacterium]
MDKTRFNYLYVFVAILGVLLLHDAIVRYQQVAPIPYSDFQRLLQEGKVKEVVVTTDRIQGELKESEGGKKRFVTNRVEQDLVAELSRHDVRFTGHVESTWLPTLLSWIVPVALFAGVWIWLSRRMAGRVGADGLMSIGKSKAKVFVETDTKVTFADVAGVDEAKQELQEIVTFLKDPGQYGRLGARMPKGILLVGPPGTGKTLLARAVAGEAGVPFFSISGSEFVEMFIGVGAARVRDLFEQARGKAPCIIFIDELDALGKARTAGPLSGGHDEKEQTLNQLLVELDGFDPRTGIVLLAASNRPEILDPALLRAGRFDRQVLVDRPDRAGRSAILKVHMRKATMGQDVDPDAVAGLTPGFTGADLANLVNEAALAATRRGAETVSMADFTAALERIVAGLEKRNRVLNPREREIVAYHEMGHALVAAGVPGSDKVHKVSIIPRGIGALGYTIHRPTEGPQGVDHPPGDRGAGVHDPPTDGGPVPDDPGGAREQDGRPPGREGRGTPGLRPPLDRRGRRSLPDDRDRPGDGDPVRDGAVARERRLRGGVRGIPRGASRRPARTDVQRADGPGDRLRGPGHRGGSLSERPGGPGEEPGAAGGRFPASPGKGDPERERSGAPVREGDRAARGGWGDSVRRNRRLRLKGCGG